MKLRMCLSLKGFWLGVLLIICMVTGAANAQDSLGSLYYLEDVENQYPLAEVIDNHQISWQKAAHSSLNLGFTGAPVLIKFDIQAQSDATSKYFEIANHKVTSVELYLYELVGNRPVLKTQFNLSGEQAIADRPFQHRNLIFPLTLTADNPHRVVMRIENNHPMRLPLALWNKDAFQKADVDRMLFQGFYFGTVVIMALYNLFIFFYVKDKSYATYVLFILLYATIVAFDKGMAMQYVWPEGLKNEFQIYIFLVSLGAAASVLFTLHFLSIKENLPRFAKGLNGLMGFWLVMAVASLFSDSPLLLVVAIVVLIPGGTALFMSGIFCWRKGVAAAPYYTISWFVVILAVMIYSAYLLGLLPVSLVTEYALQVGNMIEATLLSLGLAYRIKALDEEKRTANAMAKAKSDFLATMSHEIRTPMNGILGMTQLLHDTKLTQQQQGYLSTILGSGQTLLTVLNDILDYSKIEAGKLKTESISFNLRAMVDETADVFAVKATEKEVYYNTIISPYVPLKVDGDPTRIRQILTNFLSNAFKFTESGRVIVRVLRNPGEASIRFEVEDSGIGIPKEKLESVFQEFTQADSSTSRQYGGTGLGLPISKRLVELMGGDIGATSTINQGSVFWFSLPVVNEVPFDKVNNKEIAAAIQTSRFLQISPDDEFNQQLVDNSLLWGFEVKFRTSIHDACESVDDEKPFDIILVDQYCEDFSYEVVGKELLSMPWSKGAQLIFLMKPGADRLFFSKIKPEPWVAEYPISITHLQMQFLRKHGVSFKRQSQDQGPKSYEGMRILVVEDNPVNIKVAEAFINKLGIEPKVVDSGEEALELVCHEKREYDLIFMDCEMPGIDGYTTTRHIRDWELLNDRQPLHICALSAHAMDSHRDKCADAGMNDFLTKPLVFENLKKKIDETFETINAKKRNH